jgi:hypothetical protein
VKEQRKKLDLTIYTFTSDTSYQTSVISLVKVNEQNQVDLDSFFPPVKNSGIKEFDNQLLGKWKLVAILDTKNENIMQAKQKNTIWHFYKQGRASMLIPQYANSKGLADIIMKWHTQKGILYTEMNMQSMNMGVETFEYQYIVKGDTLQILFGTGNKEVYVRK